MGEQFADKEAQEAGRFDFNDVAAEVSEKLVRRHPHVFAQSKADVYKRQAPGNAGTGGTHWRPSLMRNNPT